MFRQLTFIAAILGFGASCTKNPHLESFSRDNPALETFVTFAKGAQIQLDGIGVGSAEGYQDSDHSEKDLDDVPSQPRLFASMKSVPFEDDGENKYRTKKCNELEMIAGRNMDRIELVLVSHQGSKVRRETLDIPFHDRFGRVFLLSDNRVFIVSQDTEAVRCEDSERFNFEAQKTYSIYELHWYPDRATEVVRAIQGIPSGDQVLNDRHTMVEHNGEPYLVSSVVDDGNPDLLQLRVKSLESGAIFYKYLRHEGYGVVFGSLASTQIQHEGKIVIVGIADRPAMYGVWVRGYSLVLDFEKEVLSLRWIELPVPNSAHLGERKLEVVSEGGRAWVFTRIGLVGTVAIHNVILDLDGLVDGDVTLSPSWKAQDFSFEFVKGETTANTLRWEGRLNMEGRKAWTPLEKSRFPIEGASEDLVGKVALLFQGFWVASYAPKELENSGVKVRGLHLKKADLDKMGMVDARGCASYVVGTLNFDSGIVEESERSERCFPSVYRSFWFDENKEGTLVLKSARSLTYETALAGQYINALDPE